ncbi:hypothetical protein [Nitrosopumilus sp.]|uniref:hypothetical protein n=1 Tax=Nitrosopumilus sp. TaxID=2024843 RepID=UPI00292F58A1|nr:hypothetical protein [Nitrosopumilus sp.]
MKENCSNQKKLHALLVAELDKLQKITCTNQQFDLIWSPQSNSQIEGKVDGNTITIYSENLTDAIDTLQHEFVDYVISQAIKPYVKLVNVLMSIITKDAYDTKEDAVESLLRLMNNDNSAKD